MFESSNLKGRVVKLEEQVKQLFDRLEASVHPSQPLGKDLPPAGATNADKKDAGMRHEEG
jgi:hypothetical protein